MISVFRWIKFCYFTVSKHFFSSFDTCRRHRYSVWICSSEARVTCGTLESTIHGAHDLNFMLCAICCQNPMNPSHRAEGRGWKNRRNLCLKCFNSWTKRCDGNADFLKWDAGWAEIRARGHQGVVGTARSRSSRHILPPGPSQDFTSWKAKDADSEHVFMKLSNEQPCNCFYCRLILCWWICFINCKVEPEKQVKHKNSICHKQ